MAKAKNKRAAAAGDLFAAALRFERLRLTKDDKTALDVLTAAAVYLADGDWNSLQRGAELAKRLRAARNVLGGGRADSSAGEERARIDEWIESAVARASEKRTRYTWPNAAEDVRRLCVEAYGRAFKGIDCAALARKLQAHTTPKRSGRLAAGAETTRTIEVFLFRHAERSGHKFTSELTSRALAKADKRKK